MQIKLQDERGYNQVFNPIGSTPLRTDRRNTWFVKESKMYKAKRILEIGCGNGSAAAAVAAGTEAEVVGIDISDRFLNYARETHKAPNLRFEKLDLLTEDPHKFGKFDFVYGNGILHHLVMDLKNVLTVLRSMTSLTGGMAFIEPNFLNPYCAFAFGTSIGRKLARLEPDEMAFRRGPLINILQEAGWKNVQVTTRDFLVPGLPTSLIKPILAIEPALEATIFTRWLAQSHFLTAST